MREIHDGAKHGPLARNAGVDSLPMDDAAVADGAVENGCVEERLRKQEAFYRNIIEGAADVTTLITPDGTILYASASMAEPTSLGYRAGRGSRHGILSISFIRTTASAVAQCDCE